jgi:Uma2 family endonuclease
MGATPRPATYADLERLPANLVGELIDGVLYASPRPRTRHARAAGRAFRDLDGKFDLGDGGPGGWHLLIEPELRLGGTALVPDIAGWRRERMPVLPDVPYIDLAPDWVCEVISPSTARLDRGAKMTTYLRHGVAHLWLLDPVERILETYRAGERWELVRTFIDDEPVRAAPFDAVEISMTPWWLPPDPAPPDQPR